MALDAYSIINNSIYTPLGSGDGDPIEALDPNGEEFFIIVATTLTNIGGSYGRARNWLETPPDLHRGGGRP